jgi:adenylate kinase family enzyme
MSDIVQTAEPISDDIQVIIEKKPRTEKQKEHLRKLLEARKAKLEEKKKMETEVKDEQVKKRETLRSKVTSKELVTKDDLNDFLNKVRVMVEPKTQTIVKVEEVKEPKPVEPKPVEPKPVVAKPKKLTGHELLDTLFNLK